ncbi:MULTISPECIES: phage major capsid protein [unclassified Clostridium]|uniref:phage major capsid protein n=1 Tax=Clostridium sp. UMB9555A TaxID=3050593 RepID=UPI00255045BD|nr:MULTISPECIES: phage major capsid protein [unclassified Clostridium]MDK7589913.1 phage major capsid protein [Clostridium sp. UMB9555B]MDK7627693.1 phage major capsid protein [Clostridium sp. UMB9555A]
MSKALVEQKNGLIEEMEGLVNKAKTETRSLDDKELTRIDEIKREVEQIDKTIAAENLVRSFEKVEEKREVKDMNTQTRELEIREEAKFLDFIRGNERALDVANNGAVIPTHIANKIIEKVKELSPIYSLTTIYNVGGDLAFPVYDETSSSIFAAYVEDGETLSEGTGKFKVVTLKNFIVGCLAKISKSLMNRTDFDLLNFVILKVAEAISEFIEKELITGNAGKMSGLVSMTNTVETSTASKIVADDLIDVQMAVPEKFQANACWIMHKDTLKGLRKLKNASTGEYLLQKDLTKGFGWELLGRPVYTSENCPVATDDNKAVFYGDMSGLYTKLTKKVELQVLLEKYADQRAIGVIGYVELDSKIIEPQKMVALTVKSA